MSTVQVVVKDGTVELVDFAFSPEEVAESFNAWRCADELAADGERGQNLAAEALQRACDDLREAVAPKFATLDDFEAFLIRGFNAVRAARR